MQQDGFHQVKVELEMQVVAIIIMKYPDIEKEEVVVDDTGV
jgi:hypothetical protein